MIPFQDTMLEEAVCQAQALVGELAALRCAVDRLTLATVGAHTEEYHPPREMLGYLEDLRLVSDPAA